jgi:NAD(P)-dependent dehydrogenase (short-subunit alcohol dehydrogenase family)
VSRLLRLRKLFILGFFLVGGPLSAFAETILLTGANSGIGLEFAKQYAAKGWTVIATHRRDRVPDTLEALSEQYDNVRIERMDVTNHQEIDALAEKFEDMPLDILLNNAAIILLGKFGDPGAGAAQSLGTLDYAQFDQFMHTNVMGPIKVAEAFAAHVKASKVKKMITISSAAGTLTLPQRYSGMYWYKCSKSALNMLMVNLANDLKADGVTVAMFHPGFVRVEKFQDLDLPGMIETTASVAGMIKVIDSLTIEETGGFWRHDGERQPF